MDLSSIYETCLEVVPKVEAKETFCHLYSIRLRNLFVLFFRLLSKYGSKGKK